MRRFAILIVILALAVPVSALLQFQNKSYVFHGSGGTYADDPFVLRDITGDTMTLSLDGSDTYYTNSDGRHIFTTSEAMGTNTLVHIAPDAVAGETPVFALSGYRTGDSLRTFTMGMSTSTNNQLDVGGVGRVNVMANVFTYSLSALASVDGSGAYEATLFNAAGNTVFTASKVTATATGAAVGAIGLGAGNEVHIEHDGGSTVKVAEYKTILTDAGAASYAADFVVDLSTGGAAPAEVFRVAGDGDTTVQGDLIVDANIVAGTTIGFDAVVDNGDSGAAVTVDWRDGNYQKVTLTDNCTFTFTAPPYICHVTLEVIQDAGGGNTVDFPATVRWEGAVEKEHSGGASAVDVYHFSYNGTNYNGSSLQNVAVVP